MQRCSNPMTTTRIHPHNSPQPPGSPRLSPPKATKKTPTRLPNEDHQPSNHPSHIPIHGYPHTTSPPSLQTSVIPTKPRPTQPSRSLSQSLGIAKAEPFQTSQNPCLADLFFFFLLLHLHHHHIKHIKMKLLNFLITLFVAVLVAAQLPPCAVHPPSPSPPLLRSLTPLLAG